jgi:hypothetical protein
MSDSCASDSDNRPQPLKTPSCGLTENCAHNVEKGAALAQRPTTKWKPLSTFAAEVVLSNDAKRLATLGCFKDKHIPFIRILSMMMNSIYQAIRGKLHDQHEFWGYYNTKAAGPRPVFELFDDHFLELTKIYKCYRNVSPERTLALSLLFHYAIISIFNKQKIRLGLWLLHILHEPEDLIHYIGYPPEKVITCDSLQLLLDNIYRVEGEQTVCAGPYIDDLKSTQKWSLLESELATVRTFWEEYREFYMSSLYFMTEYISSTTEFSQMFYTEMYRKAAIFFAVVTHFKVNLGSCDGPEKVARYQLCQSNFYGTSSLSKLNPWTYGSEPAQKRTIAPSLHSSDYSYRVFKKLKEGAKQCSSTFGSDLTSFEELVLEDYDTESVEEALENKDHTQTDETWF